MQELLFYGRFSSFVLFFTGIMGNGKLYRQAEKAYATPSKTLRGTYILEYIRLRYGSWEYMRSLSGLFFHQLKLLEQQY